jgi:hypothetical protein
MTDLKDKRNEEIEHYGQTLFRPVDNSNGYSVLKLYPIDKC